MTKKAALHSLSDLLQVGQPMRNHGKMMAAMAHAAGQVGAKHYTDVCTGFTDETDPDTGVISRSVSWTMTPTDKKAKAEPAPALPSA